MVNISPLRDHSKWIGEQGMSVFRIRIKKIKGSCKLSLFPLLNPPPHILKVSSLTTVQLQFITVNHWRHDVPLVANEAEMMSAGSLVLIHVKWREEAREERMMMKERVMNKDWRRLVWAYADRSTPFNFYFPTSFLQALAEFCPSLQGLI